MTDHTIRPDAMPPSAFTAAELTNTAYAELMKLTGKRHDGTRVIALCLLAVAAAIRESRND